MKFDEVFFFQRNKDDSGNLIELDDSGELRMKGTDEYPVYKQGNITDLVINPVLDDIEIQLIIEVKWFYDAFHSFFSGSDKSFYVQFIFYDFEEVNHLFLFSAKVIKAKELPYHQRGKRLSVTIRSSWCGKIPAWQMIKSEPPRLWRGKVNV